MDLGFDPAKKLEELGDIAKDIELTLGKDDAIGRLLVGDRRRNIRTSYICC